jgi:uncharacterized protein (DUF58 family)
VAPTRWLFFLLLIFLLGVFFQIPLLPTLATAVAVVIGVAYWWHKHALDNISYRRKFHYRRAFPDEEVPVRLDVENRKLLPISWLRIRDPWPKSVAPLEEETLAPSHISGVGEMVNLFSLRWFERARRNYVLKFRKRGVYTIGPAKMESGDLFGIYSETKQVGKSEKLTVFPKLVPHLDMELPAEDPFGDRRSRRRMFEDPSRPMGVREYRPEDEFRRIHWPATARMGELQVKVYQPTSNQVMVVCLNAATGPHHWEGVYPELLEYLVRLSASVVHKGIQDGYQVGLISNGAVGEADRSFRILPGSSSRQLAHLLEILAGVSPIVTASFDRFLMKELPRVPFGATLVIVSAVNTPAINETLVRVKQRGRKIVLISLAEEPPPNIKGIQIIHLPFKEELLGEKAI